MHSAHTKQCIDKMTHQNRSKYRYDCFLHNFHTQTVRGVLWKPVSSYFDRFYCVVLPTHFSLRTFVFLSKSTILTTQSLPFTKYRILKEEAFVSRKIKVYTGTLPENSFPKCASQTKKIGLWFTFREAFFQTPANITSSTLHLWEITQCYSQKWLKSNSAGLMDHHPPVKTP